MDGHIETEAIIRTAIHPANPLAAAALSRRLAAGLHPQLCAGCGGPIAPVGAIQALAVHRGGARGFFLLHHTCAELRLPGAVLWLEPVPDLRPPPVPPRPLRTRARQALRRLLAGPAALHRGRP